MKKFKQVLGAIIMLTGIWGGSYFSNLYPLGTWQNLPILMTSLAIIAGGLALIIFNRSYER